MDDWVGIDEGSVYLVTRNNGYRRYAEGFGTRAEADEYANVHLADGDTEVRVWRLAATSKTVMTSVLEEV